MRWSRRLGVATALLLALVIASAGPVVLPSTLTVRALAAGPLTGRTIVIDPGHGGADPGAIANGLEEKQFTLPIGLAVGGLLASEGATVIYTRTTDTTIGPPHDISAGLAERVALANNSHADAFISVHANAIADRSFTGVMTFYGTPNGYVDGVNRSPALVNQSQLLAEDVQRGVVRAAGEVDFGVRAADFYVLGNAGMPAVLVETGFITNAQQALALATPAYEQQIAQGIAAGLPAFFASVAPAAAQPASTRSSNGVTYLGDVTYPDHAVVAPGQALTKTWRVANSGTAAWDGTFSLTLQPGATLQAAASVPLPAVGAGQTADLSVPVTVPSAPGVYAATWRLTAPDGRTFGTPLWAAVVVPGPTFTPSWVETTQPTTLWADANVEGDAIARLGPWTYLQVTGPRDGDRLPVTEPTTRQRGFITASTVGPAGPPPPGYQLPAPTPPFQPFWVETTAATPAYSAASEPAVRFGTLRQWSPLLVLAPPGGPRLYVRDPATGGAAYVDAAEVGPSGPPSNAGPAPTTQSALMGVPAATTPATYAVKAGDTLSGISRALGVSVGAIAQANGITDPNAIVAGQTLQLPPGGAPFQPFWVENFVRTAVWSGVDEQATRLGAVAPFTPMQVLGPAQGQRYLVRVWTTGGQAYVDASAVGPAGAPAGA